jgi:hypothetical protein
MTELVKRIEVEQKFAEAVFRDFRAKRYGLSQCCYTDLTKAKIKKELCDWQDRTSCEDTNSCSITTRTVEMPTSCPQVTSCPDQSVLDNILKTLADIQKQIADGAISATPDSYVHSQSPDSTTWTIVHNLNKYPNVRIEDPSGADIMGEITYVDLNTLEISFAVSIAGTAYLS